MFVLLEVTLVNFLLNEYMIIFCIFVCTFYPQWQRSS